MSRTTAAAQLPTGMVTFLFTDIEGSTRLMRRLGDRYSGLLDRHLALLRQAWEAHDGHHVDSAGDGVFVAFENAADAVRACARAQRLLGAEDWPADGEIRVRMGLHTGVATPHGHDYRALAVHQAARVMSAAHGGQVLLTAVTAELVPPLGDVTLTPKGRYRVRDFEEPVPLFELSGPDMRASFPAIRAVPADGHNLVPPPTPFRGRQDEMVKVTALLGPGQLVTLTGPGGVGKTRLATEIGLGLVAAWPDGVWKVDLSSVDDPGLIPTAIAGALGVPARGGDRWEEVIDHLGQKQALLILDNCELLVEAIGLTVESLLVTCPGCAVLATSREALATGREHVWRVDPLDLPERGSGSESAAAAPAVQLFLDRVAAVRPQLALAATETVVEICRQLDGLPLALELASARLAVSSPQEVLDGLRDRFHLLRSRDPALPERQRTLAASLSWSEQMLTDDERVSLRRLGVFGSSFTLAAATSAVEGDGIASFDVPELVWSLVDKSLFNADLTANDTRYRMLVSVRDFALARLGEHGEVARTASLAASWFLERVGPARRDQLGWTGEVGVEIDNLRALVPLLSEHHPSQAQELAFIIARYLDATHAYNEGIVELQRYAGELLEPTPARVSMLTTLADLSLRTGAIEPARRNLSLAEALASDVGGPPEWDDVALERTRCDLAIRSGDFETALQLARAALGGDLSSRGRARMCSQVGIASLALGDLASAAEAFALELDLYRGLGSQLFEASALGNLAEVEMRQGEASAAAGHQQSCLRLALALGMPALVGFSLIVAARLAAREEAWDAAVSLHARAETTLDEIGLVLYDDDQQQSQEMLRRAASELGGDRYAEARERGCSLDLPAAADLADRVFAAASGATVPDHRAL